MAASLDARPFGTLPAGESVEAWTLRGAGGLVVEAITYGGIVTRLLAPDREGRLADVVLGFSRLEDYLARHPYFGAIVGRVAGRIRNAAFELDGTTYKLAANDGANHVHGGVCGFDRKLWKAVPSDREDGAPSVRLSAVSADGEEGYPGLVNVAVTYTVTAENIFHIEYEARAERATPLSLTHHSYFNLAGEATGTVRNHALQIYADAFVPAAEDLALLGRLEPVAGTGEDFREPRDVCAAIPKLFASHGSLYKLRPETTGGLVPAARLVHVPSGRVLDVSTNETYLQFYSGAFLDGSLKGKSGISYGPHLGVCLECQGYPDAANSPHMDDIILRPGQVRRRATAYAFSNLESSEQSR